MNALIASANNPVLIRWLRFIQMHLVGYRGHGKMSHIHSTTGAVCFHRFLSMKENEEVQHTLKFISSNNFTDIKTLCSRQQRIFQVLNFEGNSYYSQREPSKVPLGDGEGPLPVLDGSQPRVM